MQKMMQSDEYDGSGLSLFSNPDYEAISDNVQHWDEDVVDLEFRPGMYEYVVSKWCETSSFFFNFHLGSHFVFL